MELSARSRHFVIAIAAAANFWLWLVIPTPLEHDSGINYIHFREWLVCFVAISLVAGSVERRAEIAAACMALGQSSTYIPYELFGFASRPHSAPHFRVDSVSDFLFSFLLIVPFLLYFGIGFAMAIGPAWLGEVLGRRIYYLRRGIAD